MTTVSADKNAGTWRWIPTLYFAQGIPYVVVMTAAVAMYKLLSISNSDIAFYTSWLYLPWVIKPLWSPVVDLFGRKRRWILGTQFFIGCCLAAVALTLPGPHFFRYSLMFLWLMAFASATHDIAADGFYMLALDRKKQAYFVGIRNTFYRLAMVTGQGLIVVAAGWLVKWHVAGTMNTAWAMTFVGLGVLFLAVCLYHTRALPRPAEDRPASTGHPFRDFFSAFASFFRKPGIAAALSFMLLFRFSEAQLVKIATPFLLDSRESGGLALTAEQFGTIYGTVGIVALTIGGILGGILAARGGLRKWLWPMVLSINLPNLVYVYLAYFQPEGLFPISVCVVIEQLGYGFGFTAYTLYLLSFADGPLKTAHYAICTGFMALGMMIPGMFAGDLQEEWGYLCFFVWVCACTVPSFISAAFLNIPESRPVDGQ